MQVNDNDDDEEEEEEEEKKEEWTLCFMPLSLGQSARRLQEQKQQGRGVLPGAAGQDPHAQPGL